jgi:hypothetical protein
VIIPDKETAKALNDLARHKAIVRLLADILIDLEIVLRMHEDETASRNMENQIRRKLWS